VTEVDKGLPDCNFAEHYGYTNTPYPRQRGTRTDYDTVSNAGVTNHGVSDFLRVLAKIFLKKAQFILCFRIKK